ncbi:nucleotide-binding oligomerization domain-containing protein 2 [Erpetoichthys calabaricus]|uniref:Nucleotide-binding oligomerization domain containing 2 n=1 Tax=Erpetoichthys calabaricus TaxID=27687 RepID=A0A8C4SVK5_ERPCA|nr:nucleotide-binding oligomerization domain-containing protein 2 [Erpetoichthys calabaricus]
MCAQHLIRSQRVPLIKALSEGSVDSFESVLDHLLAWQIVCGEEYESLSTTTRSLCASSRDLLDLVESKGEPACRSLLTALGQVLPCTQRRELLLENFKDLLPEEYVPSSATETVQRQRPQMVRMLHGHIAAILQMLLECGTFTHFETEEVQLPIYTSSQQARRLLNLVKGKGEEAAQLLLKKIQEIQASPSAEEAHGNAEEEKYAACLNFQRKLRSTLAAQCRFFSTYDRSDNVCLENIYTDGILEVRNELQNSPLGLLDLLSKKGTVNADADLVLLVGEAGSGKSTLLQRVHLLWASGSAFQDWALMLPFSCRQLNLLERKLSLRSLIFEQCCWPDGNQEEVFQFIVSHPERTILTFDGFDEFKFHFADDERHCSPLEPAKIQTIVFNLLQGNLMKSAQKIVSSRPQAVSPSLRRYVRKEVCLRGFSPEGVEVFIRKQHCDDRVAADVIESLKSNPPLYGLCHVPVFCWIVSKCHKELLGHGHGTPSTVTDVYLMILQHFLRHAAQKDTEIDSWLQGCLGSVLRLGKIALDGVLASCYAFSWLDLQQSGVTEDDMSMGFLVQSKVPYSPTACRFEFLHITLQCFFAALCLVADDEGVAQSMFVTFFRTSSRKKKHSGSCGSCLDLFFQSSAHTEQQEEESTSQQITASFVAGLLSQRHTATLQEMGKMAQLGWKCGQVKKLLLKGMQKHFRSIPPPVPGEKKSMHAMPEFVWLVKCIYEMQDSDLARDAVCSVEVEHFKLIYCGIGPAECTALAFVLKHLKNPIGLQLDFNSVGDVGVEQLLPCLDICKAIYLRNNGISDKGVCILINKGLQCQSMQKIALFNNNLTDECTVHFAELLKKKQNFLSLRLGNNYITEKGAVHLAEGLRHSTSLQYLGLWGNKVGDQGAEELARALQDSSSLVWLSLVDNDIGSMGAQALAVMIEKNKSLEEIWLTNNKITREGVQAILSALEKNKKIKSVWLRGNKLTPEEVVEIGHLEERLTL